MECLVKMCEGSVVAKHKCSLSAQYIKQSAMKVRAKSVQDKEDSTVQW